MSSGTTLRRSAMAIGISLSVLTLAPAFLSASSVPSALGDAALGELVARIEPKEVRAGEWPFDDMDPVLQEATCRAIDGGDLPGSLALIEKNEDDELRARALLWVALVELDDPVPDCDEREISAAVEEILLEAALSTPPSRTALSALDLFLQEQWRCPLGERVVAAVRDRGAVEAAAAWASTNPELLELAITLEGPSPRLLLLAAESWVLDDLERPAALLRASRNLAATGKTIPPELEQKALEELFDAGLAPRALAFRTEQGVELPEDGSGEIYELGRSLDISAGALLAQETEIARELFEAQDPSRREIPAEPDTGTGYEEWQRWRRLRTEARLWHAVELSIAGTGPGATDPFDLLAELALEASDFSSDLSSRGTLLLFLSQVSQDLGQPAFAEYFGRFTNRTAHWSRQRLAEPTSELSRILSDDVRLLLAELEPFLASPREDELPTAPNPEARDGLPPGFRVRALRTADEAEKPAPASSAAAPSGFGIVRAERSDGVDVVLATSQALDPVGEISAGAYWVLRSVDGGSHWEAWPTGLRVGSPYEAVESSRLPLLGPEGLALEVRWAQIDESSITFPPIGLQVERRDEPLVVELPWEALTADRDADGLTDLYEERLRTDPERADTDGDGLDDFEDPLPGVAYRADPSPRTEALAALLDAVGTEEQRAILPRCPGDRPGLCFGASSPGPERVHFVVGEPAAWAGLVPTRRTVVLRPAEHELVKTLWGPVYTTRYPLLAVDPEGRRAVIIWTRSWQGGAARLEKTDTGWSVDIRSRWIT